MSAQLGNQKKKTDQERITHFQSVASRARFPIFIFTYVVILEEASNANLALAVSVSNEIHHVRFRPLIKKHDVAIGGCPLVTLLDLGTCLMCTHRDKFQTWRHWHIDSTLDVFLFFFKKKKKQGAR